MEVIKSDYEKYRGKCKIFSEQAVADDPTLRLVRGYYYCLFSNKKEAHWWTVKPDGEIYDPTKNQFLSKGMGEYEEFDGMVECDQCGKRIAEEVAFTDGRFGFCSGRCHGKYIGVID